MQLKLCKTSKERHVIFLIILLFVDSGISNTNRPSWLVKSDNYCLRSLEQGSATYGTRATLGTPSNFQWHAEPSQVAQNVFIIHTEVAPIGATRSIKNSPAVLIEFVHNIRY